MAGIDASIPLQTQRPRMMGPGDAMSLRNMAEQMTMRSMQMAEMQRQQKREQALADIPWQMDKYGLPDDQTIAKIAAVDKGLAAEFGAKRTTTLAALGRAASDDANVRRLEMDLETKKGEMRKQIRQAAVVAYDQAKAAGASEEVANQRYAETYTSTYDEMLHSGQLSWIPEADRAQERTPPPRHVAAAQVTTPKDVAAQQEKAADNKRADAALAVDQANLALRGREVKLKEADAAREAAKTEQGKPLPPSSSKGVLENRQNLAMAERALAELEKYPDATGWKGYQPDWMLQRTDPEGVDARAAIANIGSLVIHDRSGAAVTAAEFPRLQPFIPSPKDHPDVAKKKLKQFVKIYREITEDAENFHRDSGYNVPEQRGAAPAAGGSAAPLPKDRKDLKAGTVYQTPNGTARFTGWNGGKAQFETLDEEAKPEAYPGAPAAGTVVNGYRFKGGNPKDKANWQKQ